MATGVLGIGVDLDAEVLLQGQAEFERVHRIQAQAFAEQGLLVVDVLHGDVFKAQGIDDQLLDITVQVLLWIAHLRRAP
ncbi:hypothetical protein D3C80_2085000 [compost metagenome]